MTDNLTQDMISIYESANKINPKLKVETAQVIVLIGLLDELRAVNLLLAQLFLQVQGAENGDLRSDEG